MYGWGPASEHPFLTGGFSEYAYVMPQCQLLKAPESLDAPVIASSTCAFRTVVHGYERLGRVEPHETVVVQGSGPVGLYAVAYALHSGAGRVICIGAPDARLDVAKRWGADMVLNVEQTTVDERREAIMESTDGRGADVVVECSGVSVALPEGLGLIRRGGRYLVVGQADPRPVSIHGTDFNTRQLTVAGVLSGDIPHYYRALEFLADTQDKFSFGDLIGNRYPLDRVDDALAAMASAKEIKPVIVPTSS
jgi:threonine dehydrogenase-like Zn-dependent dehydrogenase